MFDLVSFGEAISVANSEEPRQGNAIAIGIRFN